MMKIIYWSVKLQGFLINDYLDEYQAARDHLTQWVNECSLKYQYDEREGFETCPPRCWTYSKAETWARSC